MQQDRLSLLRPQETAPASGVRYSVALATSESEIQEAQALRYQVFGKEIGAQLAPGSAAMGLDIDRFDAFCSHLLVRDNNSHEVVGTYRILAPDQALACGGYYSESEFDLARLHAIRPGLVEVGRSCVHPAHRSGAVVSLLWSGLVSFMKSHRHRYLMGCASISMADGGHQAANLHKSLCHNHGAPAEWRVFPRCPLPLAGLDAALVASVPPLLKGYLRVGAYICGEPAWDADFNTADLFLLLSMEKMNPRYAQHFGLG